MIIDLLDWSSNPGSHIHKITNYFIPVIFPIFTGLQWLCIKVGRGHWDACVGTWDLGTRGEGRGDIKHGTRGRMGRGRGRGRGDVKYRDPGDVGTLMFIV